MSLWPGAEERVELPVFPLPKLVLFPGTTLPLHVFEPRYRDMLADCLPQPQKLIAIAQLKPGWEPAYEGRPAIYDVAGVGRITEHTANPDGTYDILIEALARARIEELAPAGLRYRRATATVLRERVPKNGVDALALSELFLLATRISSIVQRALPGFVLQATPGDAAPLMADKIADQLVLDPEARQDLLETLDVSARIRTLAAHLAHLHMALAAATPTEGTPTLH
ncbi:MAG TPA: LON peptidase substrate-binding domain-containing protein [Polyangiales bacterium]